MVAPERQCVVGQHLVLDHHDGLASVLPVAMCPDQHMEPVAFQALLVHIFKGSTEARDIQVDLLVLNHLGAVAAPKGMELALTEQLLIVAKEGELHTHHLLALEVHVFHIMGSMHCHQ